MAEHFVASFLDNIRNTGLLEYIAVVFGIASVWYSRKENILVYPVGLVNTIIYVYLSIEGHLIGEASVNLYYTIVSIYGWIIWAKKDQQHRPVLRITNSSSKEWLQQLAFFGAFYIVIFLCLSFLKTNFLPGVLPAADAFASATAFTGMWLMARKKVESWYWWIATNIASIPLYYVKGYAFTSLYYFVLLVLAFSGLFEWKRKVMAARGSHVPVTNS
ncbi:MAG TPA: nicotinamide riboside transporter PnuC [Flavitalea sp.]|nr:nicotinamide riboside transporter PnuC [Flavitalea sp.]